MRTRQLELTGSKTGFSTDTAVSLSVPDLSRLANDWLLDGQFRLHSPNTVATRRVFIKNLLWFLKERNCRQCGPTEMKQFFVYLSNGHEEPGGRWGNPQLKKALRPISVKDYFVNFASLFDWIVSEGYLEASPLQKLPIPKVRASQIQPLSDAHVSALLEAAKNTSSPKRNTAILLLLLDSGLRASELCNLKMNDLDVEVRRCYVLGKGNKHRSVFFGRNTAKALWQYLRAERREPDDFVFYGDRGRKAREPLSRNGLLQLVGRLGRMAGVKAVRCSPHSLRHTYAVSFLRAGGNVFTLREALGHTNLQMTQKYVVIAEADVEAQSKLFSPMDRRAARS
jgi:site-specific recombinase XerD